MSLRCGDETRPASRSEKRTQVGPAGRDGAEDSECEVGIIGAGEDSEDALSRRGVPVPVRADDELGRVGGGHVSSGSSLSRPPDGGRRTWTSGVSLMTVGGDARRRRDRQDSAGQAERDDVRGAWSGRPSGPVAGAVAETA